MVKFKAISEPPWIQRRCRNPFLSIKLCQLKTNSRDCNNTQTDTKSDGDAYSGWRGPLYWSEKWIYSTIDSSFWIAVTTYQHNIWLSMKSNSNGTTHAHAHTHTHTHTHTNNDVQCLHRGQSWQRLVRWYFCTDQSHFLQVPQNVNIWGCCLSEWVEFNAHQTQNSITARVCYTVLG